MSRQAVSKWESAGSTPDLQRVIQLAQLFDVSKDYLLRDEIVHQEETIRPDIEIETKDKDSREFGAAYFGGDGSRNWNAVFISRNCTSSIYFYYQ